MFAGLPVVGATMQKYRPRGKLYYGWYIALALAITETISWGIIYYAFTVFITPMEAELGRVMDSHRPGAGGNQHHFLLKTRHLKRITPGG